MVDGKRECYDIGTGCPTPYVLELKTNEAGIEVRLCKNPAGGDGGNTGEGVNNGCIYKDNNTQCDECKEGFFYFDFTCKKRCTEDQYVFVDDVKRMACALIDSYTFKASDATKCDFTSYQFYNGSDMICECKDGFRFFIKGDDEFKETTVTDANTGLETTTVQPICVKKEAEPAPGCNSVILGCKTCFT